MQVIEIENFREKFMMMDETCKVCHHRQICFKLMGVECGPICAACGSDKMKRIVGDTGLTLEQAKAQMRERYGKRS